MSKHIEIRLDPLTDGFTEDKADDNAARTDRHVLIIATNGKDRLTDFTEAGYLLDTLDASGSIEAIVLVDVQGDMDFLVVFNDEKSFDLEENRFFVGSIMVMKIEGKHLVGLSEEEISRVKEILEGRMCDLVNGDESFSALALS